MNPPAQKTDDSTCLVIDCGNSHSKFGIAEYLRQDTNLLYSVSIENSVLMGDQGKQVVQQFLQQSSGTLDCVVVASVVPTLQKALKNMLPAITDAPVITVDHTSFAAMLVQTDQPAEVGADRLVNAFAARQLFGSRQIVIDFGTATTFDVVDTAGDYAGGVILPGLELSLQTLHQATARLPLVRISKASRVLGKNTVAAINQGLYWGYVAMLDGLVERLNNENGYNAHVIATGGYADLWGQDCRCIDTIDKDLTLKGLVMLASQRKNEKKY